MRRGRIPFVEQLRSQGKSMVTEKPTPSQEINLEQGETLALITLLSFTLYHHELPSEIKDFLAILRNKQTTTYELQRMLICFDRISDEQRTRLQQYLTTATHKNETVPKDIKEILKVYRDQVIFSFSHK